MISGKQSPPESLQKIFDKTNTGVFGFGQVQCPAEPADRKLFLALTKPLVWDPPVVDSNDVADLPKFLFRRLSSVLFEAGFSGQQNWRQVCELVAEAVIDAVKASDAVKSICNVDFDNPATKLDNLSRLYGDLLDALLSNASNFPPSTGFHEIAKDLVFIAEDFATTFRRKSTQLVAGSAEEANDGSNFAKESAAGMEVDEQPVKDLQGEAENQANKPVEPDFESPASPDDLNSALLPMETDCGPSSNTVTGVEGLNLAENFSKMPEGSDAQPSPSPADALSGQPEIFDETSAISEAAEKCQSPESPNNEVPVITEVASDDKVNVEAENQVWNHPTCERNTNL